MIKKDFNKRKNNYQQNENNDNYNRLMTSQKIETFKP